MGSSPPKRITEPDEKHLSAGTEPEGWISPGVPRASRCGDAEHPRAGTGACRSLYSKQSEEQFGWQVYL